MIMKIVVDYISIKMWGLVTTGTCLRSSDQGFLAVLRSRIKTIIKLLLLISLPKRLRETKSVHVYESIVNPTFLWVLLNCLLLLCLFHLTFLHKELCNLFVLTN